MIQTPILIATELSSKAIKAHFGQTANKLRYNIICIRFARRVIVQWKLEDGEVYPRLLELTDAGPKSGRVQ